MEKQLRLDLLITLDDDASGVDVNIDYDGDKIIITPVYEKEQEHQGISDVDIINDYIV